MKMNSQQLQAFAQANQDDAIKLSLAAEADKYKKQHGQEAMAMMAGQQQKPPISQQILQSIGQPPQQQPMPQQVMPPQGMAPQMPRQQMAQAPQEMPPQGMAGGGVVLPESQGIATLPVGNMDFAEGGIIGYADGGVPGYAGGTLVDQIEAANQMSLRNTGFPLSPAQRARLEQTIKANLAQEAAGQAAGAAGRPFNPSAYMPQEVSAPATASALPPNAMQVMSGLPTALPPAADVTPKPAAEPGLPSIVPTKFERTTIPTSSVADTLELYKSSMPKETVDPLAKERAEANAPAIQAAGRQVSLFEQEVQSRKPAFEERLKKLDEKEGRVNTMEDRNLNMSLLETGFAMMAGESPHAFVNIGKGAQVGVKAYTEGLAKVEAARDKVDEARARIEEFRRNEDMMTAKERRAVLRDYDNTIASASKDMFNGISQQYSLNRQDVISAIAAQRAREEAQAQITSRENMGIAGIQSSENIANAQMKNAVKIAGMPNGLERILGNPDLFKKYMESQTGPASVRAESLLRKEWAESPLLQGKYPTPESYLAANGVSGQGGAGDGLKFIGSRPAQ